VNIKFFAIAVLAATTLFAPCDKDNNRSSHEEEGDPNSMTVSISFPHSLKEATANLNATEQEVQINTVDMFIYTASGTFSKHDSLDINNFEWKIGRDEVDWYEYTVSPKLIKKMKISCDEQGTERAGRS